MKFDITKIVSLVGIAMRVAENFKGPKSGKEKEAAVIKSLNDELPNIEAGLGIDFLNDEAARKVAQDYIAARVALVNFIDNAKRLRDKDLH